MRAYKLQALALGAALAAKYTALLLLASTGLALLVQPALRPTFTRKGEGGPYLAVALALAVLAPNLIWNAGHGWSSFAYQLAH